jgi:Uma2 family endonuclease
MSVPQEKKSYTYEDYLIWTDDERWELIEGVPYMQAAPSWQHQAIAFELGRQFGNYLVGKSFMAFTAPFDLILPEDDLEESKSKNVLQPDLLIVCNKSGLKGTGYFGVPDLIIEVCSPSTIRNDKVLKFNRYEKAGVKEYWIIEPEGNFISIFTLQDNNRYGRPEIYTEVDKVNVGIFENLIIDLKLVLGQE